MKEEHKHCPHCGETILAEAKKCKYCGEWLEPIQSEINEKQDEVEKEKAVNEDSGAIWTGLCRFVLLSIISWLCFHFGGWHIVLGKSISKLEQLVLNNQLDLNNILQAAAGEQSDTIFNQSMLLFRINDSFYGITMSTQYFDSPFIQWAMLIMSAFALYYAISGFD